MALRILGLDLLGCQPAPPLLFDVTDIPAWREIARKLVDFGIEGRHFDPHAFDHRHRPSAEKDHLGSIGRHAYGVVGYVAVFLVFVDDLLNQEPELAKRQLADCIETLAERVSRTWSTRTRRRAGYAITGRLSRPE